MPAPWCPAALGHAGSIHYEHNRRARRHREAACSGIERGRGGTRICGVSSGVHRVQREGAAYQQGVAYRLRHLVDVDEVHQLFEARTGVAIVRYDAGQPFGEFYGYVADGLFQTQEDIKSYATQAGASPGDIRFKDVNGDGVINDKDRTFIGSPIPKFTFGLNNTVTWKAST